MLHVVASGRRRGAEIFAADLVAALAAAGVEQRVFVLQGPAPLGVDYGAPTTVALPDRPIAGWADAVAVVRALGRLVRSWRPDVVQAHGGDALKHSLGAALGTRAPVVYRNIGLAPPWTKAGPRHALWRCLVRRAAWTVGLADAVSNETVELFGASPRRVTTIPNAVDPARMVPAHGRRRPREELGVAATAPVLVSLAALTWEKDPMAHVEVGGAVLARVPTAVHLIAGDGPMRDQVAAEIARRGLGERVRLLGSRGDVADLLHAGDVLLFASRPEGMEGMPTILIEAGMASLPVVAYDVAGVGEVVVDGDTGLLVAPGHPSAAADAVASLLGDEGRRRQMGARARERCHERFDVRDQVPRYLQVYRAVARRRGRP